MVDSLKEAPVRQALGVPHGIPPLENGDHLTRQEFEHRYDAMPQLKKAELIEGVVYMPSPVRVEAHGEPHGRIITWLGYYCAHSPDVKFADNATLRLDPDNEPQPDAVVWLTEEAGGRARVSDDDYLEGSPELIVEIAASSASYDLHEKMNVYRRNRVQEYIVWQTFDRRIDWFRLEAEQYVPLRADSQGIIHSKVCLGLCLNIDAIMRGDLTLVFEALRMCNQAPR
jgi:Uma2 family endonuclease